MTQVASAKKRNRREYGLIVQQPGKPQQVLAKFVMLVLNYRYGLDIIVTDNFVEAFSIVQKRKNKIRCTFIIQNKKVEGTKSILSLNLDDTIPLFFLLPTPLLAAQKETCRRLQNAAYCAWEVAFTQKKTSLHQSIDEVLIRHGIGDLFVEMEQYSHDELQQRIEQRFAHINTLPTLPEVALRIMELTENPQTSAEELETVLSSDPAIVHKLLQLVNSPIFAGSAHKGEWALQDAVVRLGMKKVGAIAQQIKLMNSLVKPRESEFDMRRFWEHSIGVALIADRLVTGHMVSLKVEISFNDYWIAGLLHDIGKLPLGLFFWNHFEEILEQMARTGCTFRQAECELGDVANHEYLGQVLLLKARVGENLVEAVGRHNSPGQSPAPLTCLLHLADNLCKELGAGYLAEEPVTYANSALNALDLKEEDVDGFKEALGQQVLDEIRELVDHCLHAH